MIYISIPVHEKIDVIVNQARNFLKHLDCQIILHLSLSASFPRRELETGLQMAGLTDKVYVNPVSVPTKWGSIIAAHIENIKYIARLSSGDDDDCVVFHSSNDMLVRTIPVEYFRNNKNGFHLRYYDRPGYWWPACVALEQDKNFSLSLSTLGVGRIVASQIEGSFYRLSLLLEIVKRIDDSKLLNKESCFYPREEFYFSSFAYAMGIRPDIEPYVYSEVHVFDRYLWGIFSYIDSRLPRQFRSRAKWLVNILVFRSKFYKISIGKIKKIINERIETFYISDGDNEWSPFVCAKNIYAVKRVERNTNDKIRRYITNEL